MGDPHDSGDISAGLVVIGSFPKLLQPSGDFSFHHTTAPFLEEMASKNWLEILEMAHKDASQIRPSVELGVVTRSITSHVLIRRLALHNLYADTVSTIVVKRSAPTQHLKSRRLI
ncbi:hypothetical protein FRB97_000941 [Tulasnella sp. 331]|nr:hypothetical protein FRB97_000941 [Tulasnella sp. 331]KAG8872859.1 hypothetical protein FRB98_009318 [Tulasnella sp. 332]